MTEKKRWSVTVLSLVLGLLNSAGPLQAQQLPRAAAQKLAPTLQGTERAAAPAAVRVSVTDQAAFQHWLKQELPQARILPAPPGSATLQVTGLQRGALLRLSACPWVRFVDLADRPAHEERRISYLDLAPNAVAAVHRRFPQLTGQGLTASIKEQQFDAADIDFKGRVVPNPLLTNAVNDHATVMGTILAGAGNTGPQGQGAAWQARIISSDFDRLAPDDGAQLSQAGVSVQNHSYGVAIENYYGLDALEYDRQARQYPALLHVFSAGNVGTQASANGPYAGLANFANLTGQFKMSKNTLTVGATTALNQVPGLSSRGPAYDGRVKPELVAYGDGGTSEAAALVSGSSLLVQQAYRDGHGGALPTSALVKAALLNSADDLGRPEVDFVHGYGNLDALGAVQTVLDDRFVTGAVTQGTGQVFTFTVPPGQQQAKATLVWTDPEAGPNAPRALVNDLDLELVLPATGQRWQPWVLSSFPHADSLALPARRRADHLNNAEQITLTLPAAGTYELRVRGYAVTGSQDFSLAYETSAPGLEWLRPLPLRNLTPGANTTAHWQWNGPLTNAQLQYRPVGSPAWQPVTPSVNLAQRAALWAVPDTATLAQLRLVTLAGASYPSPVFSILPLPRVEVGYRCADETRLQWNAVPGASAYQVYTLGATHLEPYLRTADTILVLNRSQMQQLYYAVAPIVQGQLLERGNTVNYTEQGTACYFRSFQARQLVDDTLRFDVELGTVAKLRAATLERLVNGSYQAVQTFTPVPGPLFTFADLPPASDRYLYRVRLDTNAGEAVYSQVEEAFRVLPGHLLAFPNPIAVGQVLKLVGSNRAILSVQLYDMLGRFVREYQGEGVVNEIATGDLRKGLYLLRVSTEGQATQTVRVVVLD